MPQVPTKSNIIRRTSVPVVFALGAITALSFRGNAISPGSPVLPPPQALEAQTASEQVAEKLRPSVVFIESLVKARPVAQTPQDGGGENLFGFPSVPGAPGSLRFRMVPPPRGNASGSGVIVRSDGYILTNDHVVEGADKVRVKLLDGRTFYGKVMRDFKSDLALIKVDATNLPAAELADSDRVKVGQWAAAFGSPFGLTDTMTSGIISSLHRNQQIGSRANDARYYSSLLQTDASVNPGNSGGPLVDLYGRVVGINVAIESPSGASAGIGFAIPANTAKYVMEQLITNGSVTRGFLGLSPRSLEYSERAQYKVEAGALVTS
ncbi:MAG: trypsin-like peptidase domain-containing protein, partial [Chthonomonadaceae bacterium]|nr:trypsin-like peptidase domain-containing protein [Chthonomonadaceae bacterium]